MVQPFQVIELPADAGVRNVLTEATMAELDQAAINMVMQDRPGFIQLSVPFRNGTLAIDLYREDPISTGFMVRTDKGLHAGYIPGAYYRGIIAGDPASIAAFSFFQDQVIGMASSTELGNVVVERMTGQSRSHHIIFSDRDLLPEMSITCATTDVPEPVHPVASITERTVKCVRLYYEVGFMAYELNGSDVDQSVNWMTAGHNNVATLFANDGITVALSEVFVWTQPEAFQLPGDPNDVNVFAAYRTAFNGDVATYVPTGSGYARGIGGICSAGAYNVSPIVVFEEVPTFSWMVPYITHEIGHVCGSQHTHDCVWNGNNTQIDDCGNMPGHETPGVPVGPCFDVNNPILPDGLGTIMSYCGMDITLGFGPQPAQRIRDHIEAATCLGTDCINSCSPTVDSMAVTPLTIYSALLTFHDGDPNATQWQVMVTDGGQPVIDWTTINSTTYEITGLAPGTHYWVKVRSFCEAPFAADFTYQASFDTGTTLCGHHVYDAGGNGPYFGNEVHTYVPDVEGNVVSISFDGFWLEQDGDFLVIHNGPDVSSPALGTFTGWSTPPGSYTSTDPSGALTIELIVDDPNEFQPNDGWDILLSCVPAINTAVQEEALQHGSFTAYLDPTGRIKTCFSLSSEARVSMDLYDPQGRLIATPMPHAQRAGGDHQLMLPMTDLASGCYLLVLRIDDQSHATRFVR